MRPFFRPGTLLVLEEVAPDQIRVGNVVVLRDRWRGQNLVAHRVISRRRQGGMVRLATKGDNAAHSDGPVDAREIRWRVVGRWRFTRVRG